MTYYHHLTIEETKPAGGIAVKLGRSTAISDDPPEVYAAKVVAENSHPLGSVMERKDMRHLEAALGIEGGILLRFWSREKQAANYIFLHERAQTPPI